MVQFKVPLCKIGCLVPALVMLALSLAGCFGHVVKYAPDGVTKVTEVKVPLGMEWRESENKLTGDPAAIDAMGRAGSAAIEVAGEKVTEMVVQKALESQASDK